MAKASRAKACHCKICGRSLRSPESIARGMGPTCEAKVLGVVRGASLGRPKAKAKQCECTQMWLFDDCKPEEKDGD